MYKTRQTERGFKDTSARQVNVASCSTLLFLSTTRSLHTLIRATFITKHKNVVRNQVYFSCCMLSDNFSVISTKEGFTVYFIRTFSNLTPRLQNLRGTQRIVSVNYLFGSPLIPYNFLKGIFTSNFRDMGNLRPGVFALMKKCLFGPKNGQLRFSEEQ